MSMNINYSHKSLSKTDTEDSTGNRFRLSIAKKIFNKVSAEPIVPIDDIVGRKGLNHNLYCGLYFLYSNRRKIIYIGQIRYGSKSSLRKRLLQHRRKKPWFKHVKFVRFHKFPSVGEAKLDIAERLSIMVAGQPIFNDKDTSIRRLTEFDWGDLMLS